MDDGSDESACGIKMLEMCCVIGMKILEMFCMIGMKKCDRDEEMHSTDPIR